MRAQIAWCPLCVRVLKHRHHRCEITQAAADQTSPTLKRKALARQLSTRADSVAVRLSTALVLCFSQTDAI
jgi:hypothetical protein|eukprot:COSAG02_NODE_54_length_43941_cov_54.857990_22_plen_71_part_00